ncbi:hypothetical protein KR054_008360 [Drosophila jambulina]|nr:hypothetical protein KR054_008360 [Drosophila jambulina]
MNAHSTAVAIIDIELDLDNDTDIDVTTENGEDVDSQVGQRDKVREKLRRLQADHVWIREELMHLQRRMVAQRLARQRRAYQSMEQMQQLLCRLQVKYGRSWGQ